MATVNAVSRPNSTIIGGQDWSDYVLDFAPIRNPLEADGVVSVTGTIIIGKHQDNPSSLDPLLNAAIWKRSQTVRLQIANDAGTLIDHPFGHLFILKVPSLSADGRILTVEVGDYLALANSRDVPGDESGITLGTAQDLSVICQNYLEAAGIPTANIDLGGPWGYDKALPIPKANVNALAMAGLIAYSSNFRVLYQDHDGIIRAHLMTVTPGTPLLSFNVDDIPREWYEPEFEPATAPELVKVEAVGETVSALAEDSGTTVVSTADLEIYVESTYSFPGFTNFTFGNLTITINNVDATRIQRRREKQPESTVFGNGVSTKVVTDDTITRRFYEFIDGVAAPYRLKAELSTTEQARGIIDGDESSIPETYRIIFKGWSFDDDGVITGHTVETYARQKEFDPGGVFESNWRLIERMTEDWTAKGNAYEYETLTGAAAITQDSSTLATNSSNIWALRTVSADGKPAETNGDNSPPAPTVWDGPFVIEEENYSGQATYTPPGGASSIAPTEVIDIEEGLGISDAVCTQVATVWAQIYGGKEYARALTLPISDALLAIDSPLWQVAYTVDGRVRTYLVDAQAYSHSFDNSLCEALGILIGDVAA